jgi:hypothetical protein
VQKKKKAVSKRSSKNANNFRDVPERSEEKYLELLISMSENVITGAGTDVDEFFKGQAVRQRKKLQELRNKR